MSALKPVNCRIVLFISNLLSFIQKVIGILNIPCDLQRITCNELEWNKELNFDV
jgi:hypothetical protein